MVMGDGPARTPASTEALLEKALALHGAGSLGEAARLYEAILAQDGNHAFALALFGLLRAQEGAHAEALGLFDRALRSEIGRAHV